MLGYIFGSSKVDETQKEEIQKQNVTSIDEEVKKELSKILDKDIADAKISYDAQRANVYNDYTNHLRDTMTLNELMKENIRLKEEIEKMKIKIAEYEIKHINLINFINDNNTELKIKLAKIETKFDTLSTNLQKTFSMKFV